MRYCSILVLKKVREKGKEAPLCCDSDSAQRQDNECMSVGYVTGAATRGIKIKSLEIETDTDLDLGGFLGLDENLNPGVNEVRYNVRICADASQDQIEELHAHVMKTSPNFHNMARGIKVSPILEII